jgi:TP901 family phage tail tape measure protein
MSVDIGSAHGSIEIKTDGILPSVRQASSALRELDANSKNIGGGFDQLARSGASAGQQIAQSTQQATAGVRNLRSEISSISSEFSRIGTGAAVAGGALVAAFTGAGKQAADLEQAVARVSTIAPEIDVSKVENSLSSMSTRIAQSSTQLAESLNNIFSSIETNQEGALKLTEEFGRGAVAASTNAETFGTAVLGVMNAYGLSVDSASHISDVFFNTINKGVVSGDQLAHGLGQVTQAAKLAGVNFDELGALIAGVTREGGDASTNINNLQNALSKIATPQAQKGLADLGIQVKDSQGNIRDFISVLGDLDTKLRGLPTGQRTEILRGIFPDQQAIAGISTLLNQLPVIRETLDLNANAAGSASRAYETMGKTAAAQATLLRNTFQSTLVQIGQIVLPDVLAVATKVRELLTSFSELDSGTREMIVHVAEGAAGFLLLTGAITRTVSAASSLGNTISTIVGLFGQKLAAKEALTAANATLATSMEETAVAATGVGTAVGAATTAFTVLAPAVVLLGAAYLVARQNARDSDQEFQKLSGTIGTDLVNSINKLPKDWTDFFFGGEQQKFITKGVQDWSNGLNNAVPTVDDLQTKLKAVNDQIAEINKKQFRGLAEDAQLDDLRKVRFALEQELKIRNDIDAAEKTRVAFLEEEQAAGEIGIAQMQERARQAEAIKNQLTDAANEINRLTGAGQQGPRTDIGKGPLTGSLAAGQASQELTAATRDYAAAGNDAVAVDEAQQKAKQALINTMQLQQGTMQATAQAIAPLTAAMDQIAAKQAAGIPLTAQEINIWGQLPGVLGAAQSAQESLTLASADTAIALINASGGVGSFGGAAGSSTVGIDQLRGAILQLNSAMGALGQQDSQLSSFFGIFQKRIDVLEAAKKAGSITPDETAELNHLLGLQQQIGDQLGENAAKEREIAEAILVANAAKREQVKIQQAVQSAVEASKQAAADTQAGQVGALAGLVGAHQGPSIAPTLDQAAVAGVQAGLDKLKQPIEKEVRVTLTNVQKVGEDVGKLAAAEFSKAQPTQTQTITVNAQDNATAVIQSVAAKAADIGKIVATANLNADGSQAIGTAAVVTGDINNIPTEHNTVITATNQASGVISDFIASLSSVPTTFTVTANVDTSGAIAAISELRSYMPASPAEQGPFSTLPDWSSVFSSLEPAGEDAINTVERTVQAMGEGIASGIGKVDNEAAKNAADFASSIASAVTATVGATEALATLRTPNAGKITQLRDSIQAIMSAFEGVAGEPRSEDAKKAAEDWQSNASSILSLVSSGVDSLTKLGTFKRPTDKAITDFRDVSQFLINVMTQVAHDTSIGAVIAAGAWADGAGKIFASVAQGIDALSGLDKFTRPTDQAVNSFRDVAQYVVNLFAQVAADGEAGPVEDAGKWADSAVKILQVIGTGVDALTGLNKFTRPTDQALQSFRDVSQFWVNLIVEVASHSEEEATTAAAKYAENASKILSLLGQGLSSFKELASDEFVPPSDTNLRLLADSTRRAVVAIMEASHDLDTDGVTAAGVYADSAIKVVSLIGGGIEGFSKLATLVPPSAEQIHNFKSVVSRTVIEIAQAAKELDADAVKAAGEYADGAGKAVGLLGTAIGAFGSLDDKWVAPSKEAIQAVVNVTAYAVQQLAGIAGSFDKGLLEKLKEFGDAASSGFGAIRGAMDAGKSLDDEKHIKPADAIGAVLAEFQAGLGPLGQLALVSEQYRTQGLQIGANFAQAYASIGSAIPGFTPQSQTVQANISANSQNVIIHQVQGSISIAFLGENGTWVVRSLQADNTSRHAVSDMVAEDISGIFASASGKQVAGVA